MQDQDKDQDQGQDQYQDHGRQKLCLDLLKIQNKYKLISKLNLMSNQIQYQEQELVEDQYFTIFEWFSVKIINENKSFHKFQE